MSPDDALRMAERVAALYAGEIDLPPLSGDAPPVGDLIAAGIAAFEER
jgi:hypothetical protein